MSDWMAALSHTVDAAIAPAQAAVTEGNAAWNAAQGAIADSGGDGGGEGGEAAPSTGEQAATAASASARAVQGVAGAVAAAASLPLELANTGIALATNAIAAVAPSMPAATLGSLYVGMPHAHSHPPSLVPPAPPVPLPSLGAITLGSCVQVLINGIPAARAGSIGMAPTCGGLVPMFNVFLGSSNVFIGGQRAARMLGDVSQACTPPVCPGVAAAAGALRALSIAGNVAAGAGVVADAVDAAAGSGAEAAAHGTSAAMGAAQMAADAQAAAAECLLGKDPAVPPALPGTISIGSPTVLIGGIPIPNIADIASRVVHKLARRRPRAARVVANVFMVGPSSGCG